MGVARVAGVDTVAWTSGADRSQPLTRRLTRIALWIGGIALLLFVLERERPPTPPNETPLQLTG